MLGIRGHEIDTSETEEGICETSATCYYVAPDGDDNNDGSFGAPFKTFLPAVTSVGPGDIIYARGGGLWI